LQDKNIFIPVKMTACETKCCIDTFNNLTERVEFDLKATFGGKKVSGIYRYEVKEFCIFATK
jgi:hypothetical protein